MKVLYKLDKKKKIVAEFTCSLCVCDFICGICVVPICSSSLFWCLWRAMLHDCGISWVSSFIFLKPSAMCIVICNRYTKCPFSCPLLHANLLGNKLL